MNSTCKFRFWMVAIATAIVATAGVAQNNPGPMTPMAVAGQLINDAKLSFARVRDYTGLFYRQERVSGELLPEQTIQLRVRQQPFSVYMKWLGPAKYAGQEAVYVSGKNKNQMRAKAPGILMSAIGFITLDPHDPKVMSHNRHPITDCGMGFMLDQIVKGFESEQKVPPDQFVIAFGEFKFLQKTCTRMESVRRVNNGQFYCHRTVVYFDRETRLPVRFEAYDWPRPGSTPGGDLLECYSYVDMKYNVNLTDAAFTQ